MDSKWRYEGVLIACLLLLGGCDSDTPTAAPTALSSVSESGLVDPDAPCDQDVVLEQGSGMSLRYDLLDELRLHARDDGVIEECEAIALAVGPRELDLRRVAASLENSVWAVTLIERDGCEHWAEFDALTGRAKGGGGLVRSPSYTSAAYRLARFQLAGCELRIRGTEGASLC